MTPVGILIVRNLFGVRRLREYTYVPKGSGIVYITITPRLPRGCRQWDREGLKCQYFRSLGVQTAADILTCSLATFKKPSVFEHQWPDCPEPGLQK